MSDLSDRALEICDREQLACSRDVTGSRGIFANGRQRMNTRGLLRRR